MGFYSKYDYNARFSYEVGRKEEIHWEQFSTMDSTIDQI